MVQPNSSGNEALKNDIDTLNRQLTERERSSRGLTPTRKRAEIYVNEKQYFSKLESENTQIVA